MTQTEGAAHGNRGCSSWTAVAAAALFAALAWPALAGNVYGGNDLEHFHLPLRWFYASALAAGHSFDWIPSLFAGFYLTGEGQAGTWHPLHLVLYRLLPLPAAFCVEVLSAYLVLFAGTLSFLRRPCFADTDAASGRPARGLPVDAAIFGATLFTFSSSTMLHFVHPNAIAVVSHLPWSLAAIDVATGDASRGRRLAALAALAALTASALLCGYPQYVWIAGCAELAWAAAALTTPDTTADTTPRRAAPLRAAAGLVAAKLLGAAMAAIQLLPTWEHLQGARRFVLDQDMTSAGSLHPLNLVQLVAPYLFRERAIGDHAHEYGVYAGALPLLLLAWLFASRRARALSCAHRTIALVGAVALLLALGRYSGTHVLQGMIPVVGTFRFPARFLFLFHFATSTLAAVAFARLASRPRVAPAADAENPGWFLLAVSVLLAAVFRGGFDPGWLGTTAGAFAGPLLFAVSAVAFGLALRGASGALPAIAVLAALDAGAYGLSASAWPMARPLEDIVASVPAPPEAGARIATLQPGLLGRYTGNLPLMRGVEMFDGYAGLPQALHPSNVTLQHLRLAAVDHVLRTAPGLPLPGLVEHGDAWFDVPDPLPRVRLATRSVVTEDAAAALKDLPAQLAASTVFASSPFLLEGPAGRILGVEREPGLVRVRVDVPSRQVLVVTERFHDGWRATVDGRAAPVHPVDAGFLGVEVAAGSSMVELAFAPEGLRVGRAISVAATTAWALLLAIAWSLRGREGSPSAPPARER